MVEPLQVLEGGNVYSKDVEFPGVLVLFEGVRWEDEEDEGEVFKGHEFFKARAVLLLVLVEGGDLVGDLVAIFVSVVDVVGERGVLGEEIDDEFKHVGFEGVL